VVSGQAYTDVNSKTKKTVQSDRQQAGTLPTLPVSCLQQENRLSLIVSDLSTNCRAYLQRLTIQKSLFVILYLKHQRQRAEATYMPLKSVQ